MKRTLNKILSVLLAAALLVGISPLCGIDLSVRSEATDLSSYEVGDTFEFGSYPQSKVTDSDLLAKLEAAGEEYEWISYGYYSGTGNFFDGEMKPGDFMLYKDFDYDGTKYRAVNISGYRPHNTGQVSSVYHSSQSSNGYFAGNTYYFRYEPITWRVLDPSEGYVMSNTIIDAQAYQNFVYQNGDEYYNSKSCESYASDWATSSLRQWLNNDFYNTAFSAEEKARIGTTHLENKSTSSSTYDSANTYDKIFLISYDDASNGEYGFSPDRDAFDAARKISGTDYASCQGLRNRVHESTFWFLRSPVDSRSVAYIDLEGSVCQIVPVIESNYGVIPAFKFNPKHEYTKTVTDPTCTEQGYTTYTCDCGDKYVDDYVDALDHSPVKINRNEPTCTEDGNIEYWKCNVCKKLFADEEATTEITLEDTVIPASHSLEYVERNEATCTEDGNIEYYTCSVCDRLFADKEAITEIMLEDTVIPAKGHDYDSVVTPPTCTESGYTTHICANCGNSYVDSEVPATGHSYRFFKCVNCGMHYGCKGANCVFCSIVRWFDGLINSCEIWLTNAPVSIGKWFVGVFNSIVSAIK